MWKGEGELHEQDGSAGPGDGGEERIEVGAEVTAGRAAQEIVAADLEDPEGGGAGPEVRRGDLTEGGGEGLARAREVGDGDFDLARAEGRPGDRAVADAGRDGVGDDDDPLEWTGQGKCGIGRAALDDARYDGGDY